MDVTTSGAGGMGFLTGPEIRRFLAKKGGLYSAGDLARVLDTTTAHWPKSPSFPKPGWISGRTPLFAGWEVWLWLLDSGRPDEARKLKSELEGLKRRKFK